VDSGRSLDSVAKPTIGKISKAAEIAVIPSLTYQKDATYLFKLAFDHYVPIGGFLMINLPYTGEIIVSDSSKVTSTCLLIES
jgi:hypothetical protein